MEPSSVDSVVCDPPYGLRFMGKEWDHGVPGSPFWTAALRVAKPGAYLLAFGGTRTWHRLACAVEDAGWEIRDTLCWLYGQGFPKGKRCLKPAWEPIIMARKAGPGELQIDPCRLPCGTEHFRGSIASRGEGMLAETKGMYTPGRGFTATDSPLGRWPANVCLDEEAAAMLDAEVGILNSGARVGGDEYKLGRYEGSPGARGLKIGGACESSSGGPSRFFYCAKASRTEREAGLEGFAKKESDLFGDDEWGRRERAVSHAKNPHPTVKPISLMRWLCRLVTPPGGLILDPFAGSGTTGCAAVLEGFRFVGCEKVPEYAKIAEARIAHWSREPLLPMEVSL
jgi:site-specific DNA-methyltransferase (adenine-specific)